jgi:hypothetical protein
MSHLIGFFVPSKENMFHLTEGEYVLFFFTTGVLLLFFLTIVTFAQQKKNHFS